MAHVRQQIRQAVKTKLIGLPTTGNNVFDNRLINLTDAKLPALLIETNPEQIDYDNMAGDLSRKLSLTIKIVVKEAGNVDDTIDSILAEVEAKLNQSQQDNTLNGLVNVLTLTQIDVGFKGQYELPIGQAEMQWQANYFTNASNPEVSI